MCIKRERTDGGIIVNEFVREVFSAAGDICDNELFLKRTPTADKNFLQTQNCVIPMKVQRH